MIWIQFGISAAIGIMLAGWLFKVVVLDDPMRCPGRWCFGKLVYFTVLDLMTMLSEHGVDRKDGAVAVLPVAKELGLVWYRCGRCHRFWRRRS